jgi:hypothetical protein
MGTTKVAAQEGGKLGSKSMTAKIGEIRFIPATLFFVDVAELGGSAIGCLS